MKRLLLIFSVVITAISCDQHKQNDNSMQDISTPKEQVVPTKSADSEAFTLYRKTENIFHVARALTTSADEFDLYLYEVNPSTPEAAKQNYVSVEHCTQEQLAKRKTALQTSYNWIPIKNIEVLFVQIQPKEFKNEIELLDKRQNIETQLSNVLESKKLGEWLASDLGPGGGNMLYKVTDIDTALEAVLTVIRQNNLDKNVLVGRRVYVADDDWFYEVVYPTKFTGSFNTM